MSVLLGNGDGTFGPPLLGRGDGSFEPALTYASGSAPQFAAVADFNGEGDPDVAAANVFAPSVSVLLMSACGGAPGQLLPTACVQGAPAFTVRRGAPEGPLAAFVEA